MLLQIADLDISSTFRERSLFMSGGGGMVENFQNFKKTAFDIFTSQIFHLIYKSMIKLPLLLCKTEPLPLIFLFVKYFKFSPQCSGSISGPPFSV